MGRKYNKTYKKGKYLSPESWSSYRNRYGLSRSQLADKSKLAKVVKRKEDKYWYNRWKADPRKLDIYGIDTPPTKGQRIFNYKLRSKKKLGKKVSRQNKSYRRYWLGRK